MPTWDLSKLIDQSTVKYETKYKVLHPFVSSYVCVASQITFSYHYIKAFITGLNQLFINLKKNLNFFFQHSL